MTDLSLKPLIATIDRAIVTRFFDDISDYIWMEREEAPGPAAIEEFFFETPPGCDLAKGYRIGLFLGSDLIAIASFDLGYPNGNDAYLGFLTVSQKARGQGYGAQLLRHVETLARKAGMRNLYLGVLDANPKGLAFWKREGFRITLADQDITLGAKTQKVHRMGKTL